MIKKILFFSIFISELFSFDISFAQSYYKTPRYNCDSLLNVQYTTAIDFAGNSQNLLLDIYKPKNDTNCKRPLILFIHGGAWIAGSKEDVNMTLMSKEFAKRGWVVANINYRLGTHKASNYTMYAFCNNSISQPCSYISDSSEIYRANFRGMQDAKAAIRFMKSRYLLDSTDINNVYLCGESAGGFIALAAAFTDQTSEKPANCFAINNAPNPDIDLYNYGCILANNGLTRPDLGSIEGVNTTNFDASVKGVASIYGGVFNTSIFQQIGNTPAVYLYHQGSDVIVNYNYGKLLGRLSWECYEQNNICQPIYFYPYAYGGEKIRQHFISLGSSTPVYQADIINNYNYLNDCFANGHSIDNFYLRLTNIVNFFANQINNNGNIPTANCASALIENNQFKKTISIYPNPSQDFLYIHFDSKIVSENYVIYDQSGQECKRGVLTNQENVFNISNLSKGFYYIKFVNDSIIPHKFIKQ